MRWSNNLYDLICLIWLNIILYCGFDIIDKMKYFKLFRYYYSDLDGKSGRLEFGIYLLIELFANFLILYLKSNLSLNDKTIINWFYILLILNIYYIPIQAATTRRLRDLGINSLLIIFSFIPIFNIFFKLFLFFKKTKKT